MIFHWAKVKVVLIWFSWLVFGIIFMAATHKYTFAQGLLFSISSMSTGGLKSLPEDAPDWEWFVVGFFAATGVPLMGMAMVISCNKSMLNMISASLDSLLIEVILFRVLSHKH